MPAKLITRRREYQPSAEQEQAAPVAQRPLPEADEDEPMEIGRPYQAFVESEARKYWEDMVEQPGRPVKPDRLVKPDQQELRAAAMPILIRALRNRGEVRFLPPTVKAHMAVNAMHRRAADRGETKRPYNGPYPNPDYIEALLQYMENTRLAPQEIPLPWHPEPKHPPIYYYIDPITKKPTPREDALICAKYVRVPWHGGDPVTEASHIHPSVDRYGQPPPVVLENKLDVYYRLRDRHVRIEVVICFVSWRSGGEPEVAKGRLHKYRFTPHWLPSYDYDYLPYWQPFPMFDEGRERKYWEDMVQSDILTKPDRQKLRAAAMPILIQGLRRRSGTGILPPTVKAHLAVDIMHQRAAERGETTEPYTGPYPSPDYTEALIQFADDTRLSPREIPLPEHEGRQHPPIYYYIDPITMKPTPREDALLRAEYVRDPRNGKPVTRMSHIHPSTDRYGQPPLEVAEKKSDVYYRLFVDRGETKAGICRIIWRGEEPDIAEKPLSYYDFTVVKKLNCSLM